MADLRIAPISAPSVPAATLGSPAGRGGEGFSETLKNAVAAVNDLQLDARDAATAIASGQGGDSAQAFVTIEKANVSFQFALQIRNKLLEAYQEIMRMQV
jgi:flagellar hook-basal body complex protein FliE